MKKQRGFTMVELAIALAITGVIASVVGGVVQATMTVPERAGDQVNAAHAIQNAVYWVSIDGQTARSANGGTSLELTLPDHSDITYSLSGDELHRTDDNGDRIIAQGISTVSFTVDHQLITMYIVAGPESRYDVSENGTYQVCMRSN